MLIGSLLILVVGCSPTSLESQAEAAEALEPSVPESSRAGTGGQSLLDSDELIGLGELGLLPSLLPAFGAGIDCDFDDALSTCQ